jgi:hypothetical protein
VNLLTKQRSYECDCKVDEDHGRDFHEIAQVLKKNIHHDVVFWCNLKGLWMDTSI